MARDLGTYFLAERYNHAPAVVRLRNGHLEEKPRLLDRTEYMTSLK